MGAAEMTGQESLPRCTAGQGDLLPFLLTAMGRELSAALQGSWPPSTRCHLGSTAMWAAKGSSSHRGLPLCRGRCESD